MSIQKKIRNKLNKDKNFKEVLVGSFITFSLKMIGFAINYFMIYSISKTYHAEGVGIFMICFNLLTLLATFSSLGMNISVLRFLGQFNKEDKKSKIKVIYFMVLKMVVPFSLICSVILFFCADVIAFHVFKNPDYKPFLELSSFILPFFTLNMIQIEFIRGLKKLKVSEFLRSISRPLFIILIILIFHSFILDKGLPLYALLVAVCLNSLISYFYLVSGFSKLPKGEIDPETMSYKYLRKVSLPMMVSHLSTFLLGNAAAFILESMSSSKEVGIFTLCLRIAMIISLILQVMNTILAPKIAELFWSEKIKELKTVLHKSSKLMFYSSILLAVGILLCSTFLLDIFGSEFVAGSSVLLMLTLGQLISSICGSNGIFLDMTNNQLIQRNTILISLACTIILCFVLIPPYGSLGAAFATTFGLALKNIVACVYLKWKLNYTTYYIPFITRNNF